MNFDYTEEQTLLDNMVTSFVRDNYDWDTRCNIVKSEEGWKEENWKQFAELGLLGVPFDEAYGGLGGKSTDLMIVMEQDLHADAETSPSQAYHVSVRAAPDGLA